MNEKWRGVYGFLIFFSVACIGLAVLLMVGQEEKVAGNPQLQVQNANRRIVEAPPCLPCQPYQPVVTEEPCGPCGPCGPGRIHSPFVGGRPVKNTGRWLFPRRNWRAELPVDRGVQAQPAYWPKPIHPDSPDPGNDATALEHRLVDAINLERNRRGLRTVEINQQLLDWSRAHCYWMASNANLRHGRYPVAEIIASGQRNTAEAVDSWMSSPGHRNIILGGFREIGVGAYTSRRDGQIYWLAQFR